jgi:hypothetical protein
MYVPFQLSEVNTPTMTAHAEPQQAGKWQAAHAG